MANDADRMLPATIGAMSAGNSPLAIVPTDVEGVFRLANLISKSGIAPHDMDTPEKVTVALLQGLEVGLPPMAALQSIAIINGRPCIWGDGAMGLVRRSGLLEVFREWVEGEDTDKMTAFCTVKRFDMEPVTHKFSVADAKAAKLWGKTSSNGKPTPWVTYPKRMLAMRPRSWCLRDCFADVLRGLGIAEEVKDTEPRDITPKSEVDNLLEDKPDAPAGPGAGEQVVVEHNNGSSGDPATVGSAATGPIIDQVDEGGGIGDVDQNFSTIKTAIEAANKELEGAESDPFAKLTEERSDPETGEILPPEPVAPEVIAANMERSIKAAYDKKGLGALQTQYKSDITALPGGLAARVREAIREKMKAIEDEEL